METTSDVPQLSDEAREMRRRVAAAASLEPDESEGDEDEDDGRGGVDVARKGSGLPADTASPPRGVMTKKKKTTLDALRASIATAKTGVAYSSWSKDLLRRTCHHRGIKRVSQEKDAMSLVKLLQEDTHIYHGFNPSMYRYDGVDYPRKLFEAIVTREDGRRSPSSVGGGRSSPTSAGSDSEAGTNGRSSPAGGGGGGPPCVVLEGGTRKTRHFFARLCGIFSMDDMKMYLLRSKLQLTRKELDEGKSGANGELWQMAAARFSNTNLSVPRISDHMFVASCDPNTIDHPGIEKSKMLEAWRQKVSAYATAIHNFRGTSGQHAPFEDFCNGDMDLYWIHELVELIPDLAGIVEAKLPDGTSAEDDGTGGGQAGDDNVAIKRHAAKRTSEVARTEALAARHKSAADRRSAELQKATQASMAKAVEEIAPLLDKVAPKPSAARLRMEEAESKSARLAFSADLHEAYKNCSTELAAELAKGKGGDAFYVGCLQKKLDTIKKSMEKDADEEL
eukprot:g17869.t1